LNLTIACATLNSLMSEQALNSLRELPSVDRMLKHPDGESLLARYNRDYVIQKCREILDELRSGIRQGRSVPHEALKDEAVLARVGAQLAAEGRPGLVRVVNATGTILHTNLGRALLSKAAMDAVLAVGGHPVNLEYDLNAGKRGRREETIEKLLIELTGAEAATVVNNNAAAVLLGLNTLAERREVIVSRGESAAPIAPIRKIMKKRSAKTRLSCSRSTPAIIRWSALRPKWSWRSLLRWAESITSL
jgi:L-seryl-tRNA(Ser) seleniumtransferase